MQQRTPQRHNCCCCCCACLDLAAGLPAAAGFYCLVAAGLPSPPCYAHPALAAWLPAAGIYCLVAAWLPALLP
eukprot:scaffold6348_cov19-Tisochrysis_lutea.AAC.1